MAVTYTTNYNLRKQAKGDLDWHTNVNWDLDTIDSTMKANETAAATADGKAEGAQDDATQALSNASAAQSAANDALSDAAAAQGTADDALGHATQAQSDLSSHSGEAEAHHKREWKKYAISASVNVDADDTYVGEGFTLAIPAKSVLFGFLVENAAPSGAAGGSKTIEYSIGTVANADGDLTDATDVDVMVATPELTGSGVHGNEAGDHVAAYFPMDMYGRYFANATDLKLNFIGKSSGATAEPGTVTCAITVWAIVSQLS